MSTQAHKQVVELRHFTQFYQPFYVTIGRGCKRLFSCLIPVHEYSCTGIRSCRQLLVPFVINFSLYP